MTSQAQINANRLNSQKSTGPRTDEGKRAVSQNAVTHGLFARDAVIKCEDPAEYELHREVLLDEMSPVGAIEYMLAERIVSLAWRLRRVERMQNETTDWLIEEDYLPLGRMVTKRWSNSLKIIEKLFMHERRIESSLNGTITKLKKLQLVRRIENEGIEEDFLANAAEARGHNNDFAKQTQFLNSIDSRGRDALGTRGAYGDDFAKQSQSPAFGGKLEALNPKFETSGAYTDDLAKQTQFLQDLVDRTSYLERHYNGIDRSEAAGNKPNRPT